MIDRALKNQLRNPQYAYIAPTYKQAKTIAWQYLVDFTRNLPNVKPNKSELTVYIERPGRRDPATGLIDPDVIKLMLIGADDPDALRGLYLDGCIIDEYAQCDPIVWGQIVRPALADRRRTAQEMGVYHTSWYYNPWAIFIGTPKGKNHFHRRYAKAQEAEKMVAQYESDHDIKQEYIDWEEFEKHYGIHEYLPPVEAEKILDRISKSVVAKYNSWRTYLVRKQWYTCIHKASETGVLSRDEIDEMKQDLSKEEVDQELECSFSAAILGSYFGHLVNQLHDEKRITHVPYNPKYPVDTHWDIGVGDKCVIWFSQKVGPNVHYIHYYEKNGKGISHYKGVLDALAGAKGSRVEVDVGEFLNGRAFKYGRHVWPHDGRVQEFGSGQTRQETARQLGLIVQIQEKQRVEDRIQAIRNRLDISFIDAEHCERGIESLYDYQKEYDEKLMMFKDKPKRSWSSHGTDAFGYSSLDDRPSGFPSDFDNKKKSAIMDYDPFSYSDGFAA